MLRWADCCYSNERNFHRTIFTFNFHYYIQHKQQAKSGKLSTEQYSLHAFLEPYIMFLPKPYMQLMNACYERVF